MSWSLNDGIWGEGRDDKDKECCLENTNNQADGDSVLPLLECVIQQDEWVERAELNISIRADTIKPLHDGYSRPFDWRDLARVVQVGRHHMLQTRSWNYPTNKSRNNLLENEENEKGQGCLVESTQGQRILLCP